MDRADQMQAWLRSRADEMAGLLEELVAVDTENPPGRRLGACGSALRDAMDRLGLSTELIELAPSGELEDPCVVRGGGPAMVQGRSTSTGTSTWSQPKAATSSSRGGAPARCSAAGPRT